MPVLSSAIVSTQSGFFSNLLAYLDMPERGRKMKPILISDRYAPGARDLAYLFRYLAKGLARASL